MLIIYLLGVLLCFITILYYFISYKKIDKFSVSDLILTIIVSLSSWISITAVIVIIILDILFSLIEKLGKIILWERKDERFD